MRIKEVLATRYVHLDVNEKIEKKLKKRVEG